MNLFHNLVYNNEAHNVICIHNAMNRCWAHNIDMLFLHQNICFILRDNQSGDSSSIVDSTSPTTNLRHDSSTLKQLPDRRGRAFARCRQCIQLSLLNRKDKVFPERNLTSGCFDKIEQTILIRILSNDAVTHILAQNVLKTCLNTNNSSRNDRSLASTNGAELNNHHRWNKFISFLDIRINNHFTGHVSTHFINIHTILQNLGDSFFCSKTFCPIFQNLNLIIIFFFLLIKFLRPLVLFNFFLQLIANFFQFRCIFNMLQLFLIVFNSSLSPLCLSSHLCIHIAHIRL